MTADFGGTIVFPDADGDGVPDRSDNCRFVANADQSPVATPLIVPPLPVTLTSCLDHAIGYPFAADRCDGGPVTVTNDAPALFKVGPNIVTWTATDAKSRTASATQTVTIVDTTPPTVYCTPTNPTGSSFRVSAYDICTLSPVIRLGNVVLTDGETIMINETGQPGVRLHNVLAGGIKHFHVGRGEAVVTATDESGNVGSVACPVPR
jgi:Thrombospondin type 3 repeat